VVVDLAQSAFCGGFAAVRRRGPPAVACGDETPREWWLDRAWRGHDVSQIPLVGQVTGTQVSFRPQPVTLYGQKGRYAAPMSGALIAGPGGCQLIAQFRPRLGTRWAIPVWIVACLGFESLVVVSLLVAPQKLGPILFAFILLVFLVGGLLQIAQGAAHGLRDEKEIRRRLVVLLGGWDLSPRIDL
jgi:hypothetical protein